MTIYNRTSRILHWLSAICIFSLFALGLWMVDLDYYNQWYQIAPFYHKSVGLLLAGITIFRLIWKHLTKTPNIQGKPIEIFLAKIVHNLLYLLLFFLFISGYLISTSDGRGIEIFNLITIPSAGELFENQSDLAGKIHYYCAWILIILAMLHALAAIKHHLIDKDNTLRKMIGVKK